MIISPNIVTEEKEKGTKKLEQLKHLSKKTRAVTSNVAILRKMINNIETNYTASRVALKHF